MNEYKEYFKGIGKYNECEKIYLCDAFDYAIAEVQQNPKTKKEFIDWFFSGDYIKESDND